MDNLQSPDRRASQASFLSMQSLQQLDPTPIDSPSADPAIDHRDLGPPLRGSDDGYELVDMEDSTATIRAPSTGAPGLSSSANLASSASSGTATGPGPIFYLTRIQKFSSYAMGIFTSLHLANVSLIPAITRSVAGSETYLLMTRELYQTSLSEPLLVALPVIAHVGSGIALRLLRRSQNMKRYGAATPGMYELHRSRTELEDLKSAKAASPWPALSNISLSGYAFTAFFAAHVFVNRILPLEVEGDSSNIGLAYVAHGFARHPVIAWVSYVGLLAAGCGHMIWGQAKWLGLAPSTKTVWGAGSVRLDKKTRRQRRRTWIAVHGAAAALASLWAVGGLGVVARGGLTEGWIGKVYDDIFAAVRL
ncbi:N2N2-dimethylguanosine tRNA methyltransferase [Fusarium albosuccineum]|uniref:N2N2-dimethylguanosine tRNA methyltransferase n=1 Tax=Fusarium albosuccineum TaxID=1237068 RepID=A0A8H4L6Q1_9HYPO|nr:N2N2-dimethylguanosine tRNA methyltransferase [Fusarium albosuccineum]